MIHAKMRRSAFIAAASLLFAITSNAQAPVFNWAKNVGGTGIDWGFGIAHDASGNVYVVGRFEGTADFDPGPGTFNITSTVSGTNDIFVLKLDAAGNFVWAKHMGSTNEDQGLSIALDASGNIYTTGWFEGIADFDPGTGSFNLTANGNLDIFVSKLDNDGNFVWARKLGGAGGDIGLSVALDGAGNVYTTGYYNGTADFDPGAATFNLISPGGNSTFVSKLDNAGNFVWAKSLGGTNISQGNSIAVDASQNVYTSGFFEDDVDFDPGAGAFNLTSAGDRDIFISKLDASGNFGWAKRIGETGYDTGVGLTLDASGNVCATGFFEDVTDFDPGSGIATLTPSGGEDIYILKLDPAGNFIWAKNMGGPNNDHGLAIDTDAAGNIYSTGFFEDDGDFDPGAGTFNLTGSSYDIYISKLDASGNFVWALGMGGISLDQGRSIAIDAAGNVYTTGSFLFTGDFDPGPGTFDLTYTGNAALNSDGYIHKLGTSTPSPLPTITNFTPASGPTGTSVTITGTNFSSTPAGNIVKFNGTTAAVISSTTTTIVTTVPTTATTGLITVSVGGNTATSVTAFTVTFGGNQPPVIATTTLTVVAEGTATIDLLTLITDADNNLDISSLEVIEPPTSGAPASISGGMLTINYSGITFAGTDHLTIEACDLAGGCAQEELTVEVTGNLVVYNGISPNGDLLNATWQIKNIDLFPATKNNKVTLYNRWGDEVFSADNYDNKGKVFKGIGNGGNELPTGTYFYKIEFNNLPTKTGYLVLKR